MVEENAAQQPPWFALDLFELRETFYRVMLDKQVEILGLPVILNDEFTALRIRSEFAGMKAKFCTAVKPPPGYSVGSVARCSLTAGDTDPAGLVLEEVDPVVQEEASGFPDPVPLVAQDLINTHDRIDRLERDLRRENRILNRKNERNIKRKKDLDEIKSPLHRKLHNSYEAAKFLLEDVKEEATQGAPSEWDLLGDPDVGHWDWDQGSLNLHAIIKAIKSFAE